MVFSNLVFLYLFLPIVLLTYFISPKAIKNYILLAASLFFYAWGEPTYIFLMLFSMIINYGYGIWIERNHGKEKKKKAIITFAIIVNIALLGYYKYAYFLVGVVNELLNSNIQFEPIPLPIGISFYTFHALSYLIDVYRKTEKAQRNLFDLALYITFFPQLVAGPIIRYNDVADQIKKRFVTSNQFVSGIQRFVIGLSKKVLIANPLGSVADTVFAMSAGNLTTGTAWLGIFAYTLQLYFDFSGYSDMAIGLGRLFGFEFKENFNYPYISKSVSEFWRRWHISLGNWFRDYLYIPLGGNKGKRWKVYRNLLIVWTATGFWHGASWTFMAWGAYYGVIICLEKLGLEKLIHSLWKPFQHLYVLLIVMIGWVFFRADNFSYATSYIKALFLPQNNLFNNHTLLLLNDNWLIFIIAIICSTPIFQVVTSKIESLKTNRAKTVVFEFSSSFIYLSLMLIVTMYLVNLTYNPFIYFRF